MQVPAVPLWRRLRVPSPLRGSGLRGRMTVSYVVVTLGSVISFLLLVTLTTGVLAAFFSGSSGNNNFLTVLQQQARSYALVAGLRVQGTALDQQTSFVPEQAHKKPSYVHAGQTRETATERATASTKELPELA